MQMTKFYTNGPVGPDDQRWVISLSCIQHFIMVTYVGFLHNHLGN